MYGGSRKYIQTPLLFAHCDVDFLFFFTRFYNLAQKCKLKTYIYNFFEKKKIF